MKRNVVVLIDVYSLHGGASKTAIQYSRMLNQYGYNSCVVCSRSLGDVDYPDGVIQIREIEKCKNFLKDNNIDVIHYFKAMKSHKDRSIFSLFIRARKCIEKDIRTIITVCQQPSSHNVILTPFEIINAEHIIFIDKTAFNAPLYSFIPEERKSWIYMLASKAMLNDGSLDKYVKKSYCTKDNDLIVFGRGSTFNKCPKDFLDVYDRIKTKQKKKFVVIGVPNNKNWLSIKLESREEKDIITYPLLPYEDYMDVVSSFDIMLYYLDPKMYSSIDGSLITVLRMGIPVVVYGPPAPKESIVHGVNGFIAESKEEFVKYSAMLASDESLREKIGRNARRICLEDAPDIYWCESFAQVMERLCNSSKKKHIKVPPFICLRIYMIRNVSWLVGSVSRACGVLLNRVKFYCRPV